MHILIFAWLYIALMISLTEWPNVFAMIGLFLVLGGVPAVLLFHGLRGQPLSQVRAAQRARRDAELLEQTVGNRDDGDPDQNQD